MLNEKAPKGKTFQWSTQIQEVLESSFSFLFKKCNNHSRLRSVCTSLQCKLGFRQTNESSLGNGLCETINMNNHASRLTEKTDLSLARAKSKHLKNKQKCISANRPACPNANINSCSQRKRGKGSGGERALTGFKLKHIYSWKTTMKSSEKKSVIGLAEERVCVIQPRSGANRSRVVFPHILPQWL